MSTGYPPRQRSASASARQPVRAATPIDPRTNELEFEPCAATASIFLFAQGSSILCIHHDTLAVDRRFDLHKEKILFLSVDNVSERGAGRLVVSYDSSHTAIVWDVFTGNEIARFASYEPITVATWMKNGNVAFGNSQGNVILFEPSTSEHISARTIFDPITALAPAWDCQTYAIGYQNGSILIVTLQPSFTILHTLTTARAPSPIVNLAWHASSSKQKSDMLATQTLDGDLRVWSVSKPATAETPKTIRILKRSDNVEPGMNWLAWSKNGRVIQYSDGETWAWDVRTKHVQCEPIPTIEGVRGLANYGPQATLFTLGPNHTVQQYEMSPPRLVKQAQFNPMYPPSVPFKSTQASHIPGTAPPIAHPPRSESARSDRARSERSGPVSFSTIQRAANEVSAIEQARVARAEMASPVSTSSRTESLSSMSSNRFAFPRQQLPSISSQAASGTTFSTMSPSMVGRDSLFSGTSIYPSTASLTSSRRSKGSRLRNEVLRSPESHYIDLFPRTRLRLSNVAYKEPAPIDQDTMAPDDLRRQMLSVVFGWDEDIEPLIRDELMHQQTGSTSAILLAKWLGEVDSDAMAAAITSGKNDNSDWMMLALSTIGSGSSMGKMGQAFVQRLLQQGDFHTSATILLGMGDLEDAVEVYVSRCFYMEAILLTSLIFPQDWQRQAHLVQKWGEFVVENSQQNLAMRCFYATGVDPPLPWGSPSPKTIDTPSQAPSSISSMLSPPVSPPGIRDDKPGRMTLKQSSLKVITSFDDPNQQFKFPGLNSMDHTPTNGPGVTPIAESAISPSGTPGGLNRAQYRGLSATKTATPGAFLRNRLPSIGETPVDVTLPVFPRPSKLPTPDNSGSDLEREKDKERQLRSHPNEERRSRDNDSELPLLSSARYDPGSATGKTPQTALPTDVFKGATMPSPAADAFTNAREKTRSRNASRDRKPEGLHIRMPSKDQVYGAQQQSLTLSALPSGRSDTRSDAKSPSVSSRSWTSAKSPSISGRSIDQYINSLDEARSRPRNTKKHSSRSRRESREGRSTTSEHKSKSKHWKDETSEDRGEDGRRYVRPAKRSPSSPVPMSPEQYVESMSASGIDSTTGMRSPDLESRSGRSESSRNKGVANLRSGSKASDWSNRTIRHRSPERMYDSQVASKSTSRQPSPGPLLDVHGRGRSKSKTRGGSAVRSPSSPLPYSPQAQHYTRSDEEEGEDDRMKFVEANRQRLRSKHRSSSRRAKERGTSSRRNRSPDRRLRAEDRYTRTSEVDDQAPASAVEPRRHSDNLLESGPEGQNLTRRKSERTYKRELAARELEARRESLLRNPEAPAVPHPNEFNPGRPGVPRAQTDLSNAPNSWAPISPTGHPSRITPNQTPIENGESIGRAASVGPPYGLPATPRAMRHPRYDKNSEAIPAVPEFPDDAQFLPETYYTSTKELPRSMSAPIPEPYVIPPPPSELPPHPAFHKALRPDKPGSTFPPLGSIGQHRRKVSGDQSAMLHPGIDEMLQGTSGRHSDHLEDPPILPELQHLSMPPPPPPPPPPFGNKHDPDTSSQSSNSNVGMIQMVLDNEPEDESNVIEVPPVTVTIPTGERVNSPPLALAGSPPPVAGRSTSGHRRGRSGDHIKSGIKGFTDRLRSNSRGRNTKSPEQSNNTPSPYESVPPLYF